MQKNETVSKLKLQALKHNSIKMIKNSPQFIREEFWGKNFVRRQLKMIIEYHWFFFMVGLSIPVPSADVKTADNVLEGVT